MKRRRHEIPRNRRGVDNNKNTNNDNDSNDNTATHFQRRVLGKRESTARAQYAPAFSMDNDKNVNNYNNDNDNNNTSLDEKEKKHNPKKQTRC